MLLPGALYLEAIKLNKEKNTSRRNISELFSKD